jgi:DNA-binding LacI/PurR family transcriptional regulator
MTSSTEPQPGPSPGPARGPTMRDVAAASGVSKALVSMIFRGVPGPSAETTVRVLAVADRLGYRTNRTASLLARRRTNLLGVTLLVRSAYHAELVEGIQAAAGEHGYDVVLGAVTRSHDERRAIETLLEFRCEALVLLGPETPPAELAALVGLVPVVAVGRAIDLPGVDVVRTADADGLARVVDHLVGLGHRRIVHVDGGEGFVSAARRRGYLAAMGRHGLAPRVLPGGAAEEDGAAAIETLATPLGVDSDGITAVAAFNDRCAVGVLDRLARAGLRVPEQVSVTGFDDSLVSQLARVNLTTVSQNPGEQARLAVAAAVERLDGGRATRRESVLAPRLVVRGTSAAAPDGSQG